MARTHTRGARAAALTCATVLVAACGGNGEPDPPALLHVAVVDSGKRGSQAFRLEDGRLTPIAELGRRTVFSRAGTGDRQGITFNEIYLREADGSVQQLTRNRQPDLAPQLLEDGRVAFVSCRYSEDRFEPPTCELVAIEPDRRRRETLLDDLGVVFSGELSPDEHRFLFTKLDEQSGAPTGIYVRDLRNGTGERLVDGHSAAWSPGGERIAFLSDRDENGPCLFHDCTGHADELYVANADGTDERRLTDNAEDDGSPEWSGDGKWLIGGRIPHDNLGTDSDLYAIRADGECEVQLTETARWEVGAEWYGPGDGGLRC